MPLEPHQLVEPHHIFVGGAPVVGRDAPAREQFLSAEQREFGVGIADVDRQKHGPFPPVTGRCNSTSPAWISMTSPSSRRKRRAPSGARPSKVPSIPCSDRQNAVYGNSVSARVDIGCRRII